MSDFRTINRRNPLPTQSVAHSSVTNRSGTIAAANVAQTLAVANPVRNGLFVQNLSATDALWISELGAATADQPSIKIPAGESFTFRDGYVPTSAISIIGGSLGHAFTAREW